MRYQSLAAPTWIASLVFSVVVLWWTGNGPLALPEMADTQQWVAETDSAVIAMSLVRALAYVVACYLLACSGLAVLASFSRSTLIANAANTVSLPVIRRLNQRIIGLSVVGILAVPTVAEASMVDTDVPVLRNITPAPPLQETPQSATPVQTEETWTVAKGENLWVIAENVLFERTGEAPSEADLTSYWLSLVEANRSKLVDPENPDLIFAGQTVLLPQS